MPSPACLSRRAALGALLGASLVGCGHPASRQECDELFAKNAELELAGQRITDPRLVAERIAAARAAEGDAFTTHCQGRRITGRALECIRGAKTSAQLDRCL